jgi:hypothetical protein
VKETRGIWKIKMRPKPEPGTYDRRRNPGRRKYSDAYYKVYVALDNSSQKSALHRILSLFTMGWFCSLSVVPILLIRYANSTHGLAIGRIFCVFSSSRHSRCTVCLRVLRYTAIGSKHSTVEVVSMPVHSPPIMACLRDVVCALILNKAMMKRTRAGCHASTFTRFRERG